MSQQEISDSESVFSGFEPADIQDVPELNLSDLSESDISDVSSSSDSDADDSSDDDIAVEPPQWTRRFTPPRIEEFHEQPGPNLPDDFQLMTATPLDYFWLFFTQNLVQTIVANTNAYANWRQQQPGARPDPYWSPVTFQEMCAFLGINILMGINYQPELTRYWSSDPLFHNEGISRVMSCNRFKKLAQYLHVSDRAAEPARDSPDHDRLSKIRPAITTASDNFRRLYTLSREVSVDEAMVAFSGRLSYRQYMPAKPIKRGIKVWVLCDARTAFLSRFEFYLGRQDNRTHHGLGHDVVMSLTDHIRNTHRFCFFDNFFTGVPLMLELLQRGLYACGTIRLNRKGYPPSLRKPMDVRNRGQFKVMQREGTNLTASVWKDKKLVYHLSTLSDPTDVRQATRRDGRQLLNVDQPHAVNAYNRFMGGVDLHDQFRAKYDVGRKGKKAWRYMFWFVVNVCIVNAFIVYSAVSERVTRKKRYTHIDFRSELVRQLIGGYRKRKRQVEPLGQQHPVNAANMEGHVNVRLPENRRQCKYHARVHGIRRETVFGCQACGVHLCREGCHLLFHQRGIDL